MLAWAWVPIGQLERLYVLSEERRVGVMHAVSGERSAFSIPLREWSVLICVSVNVQVGEHPHAL